MKCYVPRPHGLVIFHCTAFKKTETAKFRP